MDDQLPKRVETDMPLSELMDALEAAAGKATQGGWVSGTSGGKMDDPNHKPERVVMPKIGKGMVVITEEVNHQTIADTSYIAGCSPPNILRIIRALRKRTEWMRRHGEHPYPCPMINGIHPCNCGLGEALKE